MEKQSQFVTGDARQHRNIPDGTFNYINNDRWCYNDNARQVGHRNIDRIKHIGDEDTQIRFPAADTFTVETAGSERLRITSSGVNVTGIVTATSVVVGSGVTIDSNGINAPTGTITAYNLIANNRLTVGASIYGTSKILLSGGDGGQTDYYSGGTSYSEHIFRLLQGGSSITRFSINRHGVVVSGIATATTFSGSGASLT